MTPNIIDRLTDLGYEANAAADGWLNHGGCAVFASIVADRLAKLGIEVRGRVACWTDGNVCVEEARANITDPSCSEEWNANGVEFNHVGIEFDYEGTSYVYDSEGLEPASEAHNLSGHPSPLVPGYLDLDDLRALASVPYNWNPTFDRSTIPTLEELADDFLLAA